MSYSQQLPCPNCGSIIIFDAKLFVAGMNFNCSNPDCHTSVSISPKSLNQAKEVLDNYESQKQSILQKSHVN